jgi:SAM-dependent methyltransferase
MMRTPFSATGVCMPDPDRESWEGEYRTRGRLYSGSPWNLPVLAAGSKVLELGCGDGRTLGLACRRGWVVTGLDWAPSALGICRNRSEIAGPQSLVLGDARALPFRDRVFDGVFAIHVIGHSEREGRRQIARECSRVLRSGGMLIVREFSTGDMRAGHGNKIENGTFRRGSGIITHYFIAEEITALFPELVLCDCLTLRWPFRTGMWTSAREILTMSFAREDRTVPPGHSGSVDPHP